MTATFVQADDGRIINNVRVFTDISMLKETQRQLETLASVDLLTGLPNRRLFADRLGHAIARTERAGHGIALLYSDLDGFKPINDCFGHEVGDRVLQEIASRLSAALRAGDSVCRIGGNEFTVILEEGEPCADAIRVATRLLAACALPIGLEGRTLQITASIGIAMHPDDAADATRLLQQADAAMYAAKAAGGNCHCRLQAGRATDPMPATQLLGTSPAH